MYDIQKDTLIAVADTQLGKQSFATFSPQGDKVAFVRDNNLFISDLNTGKETLITTDGKYNHIINGMADWVYEEELSLAQAFAWSPDGSKIAYYRFDESEVKQFSMTLWENFILKSTLTSIPNREKQTLKSLFLLRFEYSKIVRLEL